MKYIIFNEDKEKVGEFDSIYDLELFVDGVREGRGESYPKTPRMSPFDYLKTIRWFMSIDDYSLTAQRICASVISVTEGLPMPL